MSDRIWGPRVRTGLERHEHPADPEDRSLTSTGIANPLIAEAIARGDAPADKPPVPATSNEELAARQVAIWASTNNIALTPRTVPNAARRSDGTCHADRPQPLDPKTHSIDVAYVDLDRNTEVVDATATWVNVISDPGLVMAGVDAAPPLVTAERAVLNFTTTTQLDPSRYANPEQLLNNVGTAFLTTLPGWAVWVVLLVALYLLPRVGRIIDTAVTGAYRLARPKPKETPQATVNPATVEVEATTENEAIRIGLLALNLTAPDDVIIKILQTSGNSLPGTDTPARVRLTRRPEHDS